MKLKREYSIAITVLGAVALLAFGINYLKGLDLLQRRNIYHAVYSNAQGLVEASALQINGYKIGQVVEVGLTKDGTQRIVITFQVNEDKLKIPKDSRITIAGDLFSKWCDLHLGKSDVLAQPGDTLQGDAQPSLTESVNATLDPLKQKAEGMIASVDSVLTTLQSILNPRAQGDIDASFTSIRQTLESLNGTAHRIDDLVAAESGALRGAIDNLAKVSANLAANNDELSRIFSNLDTLTASLASGKLQSTLDNVSVASEQLRATMLKINSGEGTLGKLATDDSLYVHLNDASKELDLLLEDLRLNPNRYFSVFGKKDRLPKLSDADIKRIQQAMQQQQKP